MKNTQKVKSRWTRTFFTALNTRNDGERYVCDICHKDLANPSNLTLHRHTHIIERRYKCEPCQVSFHSQGHLQKHLRSSAHETRVEMTQAFGIPTADNPRPYGCPECDVAFRKHGHLAKHLRSKSHITKLEANGLIPQGTFAALDKCGTDLRYKLVTTNCEQALESLRAIAMTLFSGASESVGGAGAATAAAAAAAFVPSGAAINNPLSLPGNSQSGNTHTNNNNPQASQHRAKDIATNNHHHQQASFLTPTTAAAPTTSVPTNLAPQPCLMPANNGTGNNSHLQVRSGAGVTSTHNLAGALDKSALSHMAVGTFTSSQPQQQQQQQHHHMLNHHNLHHKQQLHNSNSSSGNNNNNNSNHHHHHHHHHHHQQHLVNANGQQRNQSSISSNSPPSSSCSSSSSSLSSSSPSCSTATNMYTPSGAPLITAGLSDCLRNPIEAPPLLGQDQVNQSPQFLMMPNLDGAVGAASSSSNNVGPHHQSIVNGGGSGGGASSLLSQFYQTDDRLNSSAPLADIKGSRNIYHNQQQQQQRQQQQQQQQHNHPQQISAAYSFDYSAPTATSVTTYLTKGNQNRAQVWPAAAAAMQQQPAYPSTSAQQQANSMVQFIMPTISQLKTNDSAAAARFTAPISGHIEPLTR